MRDGDRVLGLSVDAVDAHREVVWVAAAGLVVAAALAVFGLPGADLHGPLHRMGIMDPFCGGTRALRLTARGDLAGAFWWNPLSPVLALGAVAAVIRLGFGVVTGRWVNAAVRWRHPAVWGSIAAGLVLLEVRQQSMAEVLMRTGY